MTLVPSVTWPSPPMATWPWRRTVKIVVDRIRIISIRGGTGTESWQHDDHGRGRGDLHFARNDPFAPAMERRRTIVSCLVIPRFGTMGAVAAAGAVPRLFAAALALFAVRPLPGRGCVDVVAGPA